ncbi:MAG: HAD family phosphatase [Gammaproteobacteria bacterium]
MSLALFDLDNTLLAGDSDYLWGRFLVEHGIVEGEYYERENQRFYDDYLAGTLDINEFLRFQLRPLAQYDIETLRNWRAQFLAEKIEPIMLSGARTLLGQHRRQGDTLVIITATNRFITGPIAQRFQVEHLLATELEMSNGRYTGAVAGTPCFQEGKLSRLQDWLADRDEELESSWLYSDSHNDLPLFERVSNPVAVDPDPRLARHAEERGWPVISLR